jgi:5-methylcytosine-specific restriction protein B
MSITEKQHLWNEFLARWPREKLADLTLQQYVSVNDQDTFTYWLETKTRDLGSIQGNTSAKFGIYKRGSDGKEQSGIGHGEIYSWRTRYGIDEKSVFTYVKDALVTIANAAYEGDLQTIEALDFAPLVKWKIAFLYQNQQAPVMINTFSGPMLQVLTDSTANTPYPEMYQKLINNKGQRNLLEYGAACWLDANNKKASVERQSILNHFTQIRSFKAGLSRWSEDTITAFCEVISEAHVKKLDIFITDMASGGMIRIGRKELDQNRAKEVFATFEPTLSKIKFEQRFLKRPNYFCTDVDSDLIKTINESNQLIEFSQQYPITRKPYWPDNYGDSDLDDGQELTSLETHVQEPKGIYQMQTSPLNQIFYGPPGTGKTYHTVEAAVKAAEPEFKWHNRDELKAEYDRLVAEKRIRFVTFHQSYGYEEFVEGLKAKTTEDKSIEYVVENGAFKSIADDAKSTAFRKSFEVSSDATIWKISIDGTGKSEVSNHCLANGVAAIGWGDSGNLLSEKLENNEYYQKLGPQVKSSLSEFSQRAAIGDLILCIGSQRTVQAVGVISGDYHYEPEGTSIYRSYCNQLPVNWLVTDIQIDFHALNNGVNFTQKTFYELWRFSVADVFELLSQNDIHIGSRQAESRETENYVLIIDEINRGNISKIFGELITLIEPSKRSGYNQKEALTLNLPYSGKPFSVPNNLHIIGTMNTADRSLALMDTALRRRFDFIEMMPNYDVFREHGVLNVEGVKVDLAELLKTMNQRIEVLYDREHMLGHAFLIPVVELIEANEHQNALVELKNVFKNKVLPLLQEYFFEDWNRIRLVLGDSKKSKSDWLVQISEQSFNDIFGSDNGLGNFDTAPKTYQIVPFEGENSIWNKAETYLAVYSDLTAKNTDADSSSVDNSAVNNG